MNASHTRREKAFSSANGYLAACAGIVFLLGAAYLFKTGVETPAGLPLLGAVALGLAGLLCLTGLFMLQPNESAILTLFGKYIGTDRSEGLRWAFPLYVKRRLSLRARNFNAPTLKVNDKRGNPVEISAAVVWRVRDTAQAVFEVDDFERYVSIQAEAALRHLASQYAYDEGEDLPQGETTLRAGMDVVADALKTELQARFEAAGVEVLDAKLTHLAYAAEIAQVMLRRQQAEAIISARSKIVHGAVSMVEAALKGLSERGIVELDDERKAAMVSNLLVVLCSDKETQPIINTGTLYN
ncbi:regulator of protease activity HflC (stomatin/prohibitin superfamily) [Massilia aurea]|jgi:regulator of protease activity HflC (stomatin/prohibitin superfamily)|uniref:Regulator of protease activity HflC (Stomatin/prohibitin superfamily) n=1 Tax=Massilia aurea TaxID=373040 RepID=A0A7W9WZE6_9BURK|nr:SPFH domain-containing protein [Massilia aurea]MBB6133639.1 regulator of protease activity HflC (stomatin/prohibitin superfamily) [Massilia aurea]